MSHDPLCPLDSECPGRDRPHFVVEPDTWCGGCQIECQCDLIAKVRADERNRVFTHLDALADRDHTEGCPSLTCTGCADQ